MTPDREYRGILSRTAVLIAAQGVRILCLALFRIVGARRIGEAAWGEFEFAYAYTVIWTAIADLGLSWVLLREAAKYRDRLETYFAGVMALRIPIALGIFTAMNLALPLFGRIPGAEITPAVSGAVLRLGAAQILSSLLLVHYAAFRTRGNTWFEGLGVSLEAGLTLGLGLFSLNRSGTAVGLAGAMLWASGSIFVFETVLACTRYKVHRGRPVWNEMRSLVGQAFPLGIGNLAYQIYYRADVLMLYVFWNRGVVGNYGAAYQFITLLSQAPVAYFKTILPHFSEAMHQGDRERLRRLWLRSYYLMALFSLPMAFVAFRLAPHIVHLAYGPDRFQGAVPVLQWVVWSVPAIWMGQVFTNLLIARGASNWYRRYSIYAAVMNIILNLPAIWKFGAVGAAATTVITEIFVNVLFARRCAREGIPLPLRTMFGVLGGLLLVLTLLLLVSYTR